MDLFFIISPFYKNIEFSTIIIPQKKQINNYIYLYEYYTKISDELPLIFF